MGPEAQPETLPYRRQEKRPRRAASQAEGKVTAMASGDPDVAAAPNWIATSSRECCRLERPNGLPLKGGILKTQSGYAAQKTLVPIPGEGHSPFSGRERS